MKVVDADASTPNVVFKDYVMYPKYLLPSILPLACPQKVCYNKV
jgi:hypothetical protein